MFSSILKIQFQFKYVDFVYDECIEIKNALGGEDELDWLKSTNRYRIIVLFCLYGLRDFEQFDAILSQPTVAHTLTTMCDKIDIKCYNKCVHCTAQLDWYVIITLYLYNAKFFVSLFLVFNSFNFNFNFNFNFI